MDEELKVKITADATDANKAIDKLNKTLKYLRENTRIKVKFNYNSNGKITGIKNINDYAPKWQEMYKQMVTNIQEGAGLQQITEFLSQIADSTKNTASAISEAPNISAMSTEDLQTELERVNNDIAEYDRKIKHTEDSLEKLRNATRDCSLAVKKHENRLEALNKARDVSVEWKDKIEKDLAKRKKQEETKESLGNSLKAVGLAMIGVRSVFALIRQIVNQSENLNTAIDNMIEAIAGALKPILDFIAAVINTIAVVLGAIFKVNKKTSASTNTVAKTLASFDEINNIGGSSGAGTSTRDPGTISQIFTLLKGLWDVIVGLIEMILGSIGLICNGVMLIGMVFTETVLAVITAGLSVISGIITAIVNGVTGFLAEIFSGIVNIGENIKLIFETLFADGFQFRDIISGILLSILTIATGLINTIWNALKSLLTGLWNGFKLGFKTVLEFFNKTLLEPLIKGIENTWNKAIKPVINLIISGFEKLVNGFIGIINSVIGTINKIPGVRIGYLGTKSIPRLATGGIVDNGQLFVANEAGPELIGKYGSKTGVMNNDQIVSAVSEGVYNAVLSAMQNNNQEIVLTMDGMRLTKSIVKNINAMNRIAGGSVIG